MQKLPYFVECQSIEGIDEFYKEMEAEGYELKKLWPSSKLTEYWLTADQANKISSKAFVSSCRLPPELDGTLTLATPSLNNRDRTVRSVRSVFGRGADPFARDWKWSACWGDKQQEKLGYFETGVPYDYEIKLQGDGKNVDIYVQDRPVSYDSPELSDENGVSRVVTYDWEYHYNENNGIPNTRPAYARHPGYYSHLVGGQDSHGVQSATTTAGRYHGFANKAMVYTFPVGWGLQQRTIYLEDWHKNKPKNPATGWPNATIVSTQIGSAGRWNKLTDQRLNVWQPGGVATNVTAIQWIDGQTYSASNPNPSGWTDIGVEADFGVNSSIWGPNVYQNVGASALLPQTQIQAGIPVTVSAGNSNEWRDMREFVNAPVIQYSPANGSGNQIMYAPAGIGINDGIDAHQPVVQVDGTHRRPGRNLGAYTTGFRSWATGATAGEDFKAGFSSWGDVGWFAPGSMLLCGCNHDHGLVNPTPGQPFTPVSAAWSTFRHGDVSFNTQYAGTSASNPVSCGFLACLISGEKPGPRFTMGDLWRTAERVTNNQNMSSESRPSGIEHLYYDLDMTPTANITYTLTEPYNPSVTYPFGTNIQRVYGDHELAIVAGGLGWVVDRYDIVGVGANNSSYQFIDYNTFDPNSPYAPYAVVDNPTINLIDGQFLFSSAFPSPHTWLETHHPIEVRSNPDDPNTVVSWAQSGSLGLFVSPPIGTSGTFWYVCKHHGAQMRGRIVVTAANYNETFVLKNTNTTGSSDLVTGVKYFHIDPNNPHTGVLTEVQPGDPGFRGLKYPGEYLNFEVPSYNFLTIGHKYYFQSQQNLSKFVSFEVMERIGNIGKTRSWAGGIPYGSTKTCHFDYERPKEKVQDRQVGQRPYVFQQKANSIYEYNIGWGPTYPRINRRYYNNQ